MLRFRMKNDSTPPATAGASDTRQARGMAMIAQVDSRTAAPQMLLITHYFPAHRGGVEIVAGELAARLAPCLSLHWLAADCDAQPEGLDARGQRAWNGLERFGLPWPIWHWKGWRTLSTEIARADVVHIHDFIYPACLVAFVLTRVRRKPLVVTQHIGDIAYRNPLLRALLRAINRSVGRLVLSRAEQTIFISAKVKTLFEGFTSFHRPPLYWANGVDRQTFRPCASREVLRASLGADVGRPAILFVGRFVPKKGLAILKELAALRPDWQWWLAGWGEVGPLHPTTWELPQVRVWEGRSGATLAELYQAADVLVLPSYGEGFPLVIQEAIACGTPVVTSADTASGGPAAAGIITPVAVDPANPCMDDWLRAIAALLQAPHATRAQAADFAAQEWDWDALGTRYAELFTRLARPGGGGHPANEAARD
jgi:glycosyltransferase involved in cell wall biosynthesis